MLPQLCGPFVRATLMSVAFSLLPLPPSFVVRFQTWTNWKWPTKKNWVQQAAQSGANRNVYGGALDQHCLCLLFFVQVFDCQLFSYFSFQDCLRTIVKTLVVVKGAPALKSVMESREFVCIALEGEGFEEGRLTFPSSTILSVGTKRKLMIFLSVAQTISRESRWNIMSRCSVSMFASITSASSLAILAWLTCGGFKNKAS